MNKEGLYETIEKYIAGTLSGTALVAFEERLQKDEALVKEVNLHRRLEKAILDKEVVAFEKLMKKTFKKASAEKQLSSKNTTSVATKENSTLFSLKKLLPIAASILLFALIGLFFFNKKNATPNIEGGNGESVFVVHSDFVVRSGGHFGGASSMDFLRC